MLIGYARCSTDAQDLTAQRDALTALGVQPDRIYTDHGLTGTNRARPGLREALAACRVGDTLVVTKLDRLARSLTDARDIVEELTETDVKLNIGGSGVGAGAGPVAAGAGAVWVVNALDGTLSRVDPEQPSTSSAPTTTPSPPRRPAHSSPPCAASAITRD